MVEEWSLSARSRSRSLSSWRVGHQKEGTHFRRLLFPQAELSVDAIVRPTTQGTTARRDVMTGEACEPLGGLEAKVFDADGCDASSFIALAAEDPSEQIESVPLDLIQSSFIYFLSVVSGRKRKEGV